MIDFKSHPRLPRTTESTIYEIVTAVLLIAMWGIIMRIYVTTTGEIPTHFNISGQPDGYGSKGNLIVMGVVATSCAALFTVGSYYPKQLVNVPIRIDTPHKLQIMSRMCRQLGVEMVLMFLLIVLSMGGILDIGYNVEILVGIMILDIVFSCIEANRSK